MSENSTLIHDLPSVTIRRAVVSEMANNVYLLTAKATGAQILIDAADDAPAIAALLADAAADAPVPTAVKFIATTHQHWDHVRALAAVVALTGAPTAAGTDDDAGIQAQSGVSADRLLGDGDVLGVDGLDLSAVHLRGHTPGSIAYVLSDAGATVIFSGDSLFPGGVGNTEKDPARFTSLLNDVQERLFGRFGDDAVVLPGHGDATTLGTERPALPEWRERGW
ncbi:Zn-dependent hydrolase [Arthrobacter sp. ERGS1:01]|uniref:MBL fold metallo-hydrolase n=1 Tax=Arthrobacter sp. ERGS1:01 TaxID=1704044 RepID=UPI0006B43CFA|nr:MBL fold metallo-hydrolase [Arthrobacter sp. ERGS1:01]ALE05868.1 Zn-dependent hydrolase [Arthrobacter sp. ERGS1:01]